MSVLNLRIKWTKERDTEIALLWWKGLVLSDIAAKLPYLSVFDDGGKNAVTGRINRLRNKSESDAERKFWSRGKSGFVSNAVHEKKKRIEKAGDEKEPKISRLVVQKFSEKSGTLAHTEKISLIDTVIVPPITVTDAEVNAALRKRMLYGNGSDDNYHVSWHKPREFHVEDSEYIPRCTETVSDGPCGIEAVKGTARCERHGGKDIKNVKKTGNALKDPD